MSPESRDDDKEPRESPPPARASERPHGRSTKSAKSKPSPSAEDAGEADRREAASSSTAERPPRATAKRPSTPTAPNSATPTQRMPEDPQDELPPHGDALLTRAVESPSKIAKPRGRASSGSGGGKAPAPAALLPNAADLSRLLAGEHAQPHEILGAHALTVGGTAGVVIRALMPNAVAVEAVLEDGRVVPLDAMAAGLANLYSGFIAGATLPLRYRLRFHFADGAAWERDDAYRFLPTIGDIDLHLFGEGTHRRLWEKLGAHVRTVDGVQGVSFVVWAPNARRVSVVGDFCGWDGRIFPMRSMGAAGVYELFVP